MKKFETLFWTALIIAAAIMAIITIAMLNGA